MSDDDFGVQYTAPRTMPYRVDASFHLPHQCDEWVIGEGDQAINEMRAFIAECQAVLDAALANPDRNAPTDTPTVTP